MLKLIRFCANFDRALPSADGNTIDFNHFSKPS